MPIPCTWSGWVGVGFWMQSAGVSTAPGHGSGKRRETGGSQRTGPVRLRLDRGQVAAETFEPSRVVPNDRPVLTRRAVAGAAPSTKVG